MKKFLTMFLFATAVVAAFSFILAGESSSDGEKKFVLHGEIRQRADYSDNLTDFTGDSDDSFLFFPYRARIGAEGHFTNDVTGYVEFQSVGHWGNVPPIKGDQFGPVGGDSSSNSNIPPLGTPTNVLQDENSGQNFSNDVELYQAYIALNKIGGSAFSLKLGRQEIVKGSEMLLGDLDFYSGISHDGAMGCWQWKHFDLDVWWTRPLQSGGIQTAGPPAVAVSTPDHQSINFYGAWLDWNRYSNGIAWSAYIMDYEDGTVTTDNPTRRQFWTIGGRTDRKVTGKNGFYWNAEYAIQSGDYNNGPDLADTGSISAWAWEGTLGYNFHGKQDRKIHVTYDVASGDDSNPADPNQGDAKAFDPLFQDVHGRYGFADLFSFSDLTVLGVGYSADINDRHSWGVDYFKQSLSEKINDPTSPADGKDSLGQEIDGWWKFEYTQNAQVLVAAAWFDPGDAIDAEVTNNNTNGLSSDSGLRLVGQIRLRW